MKPTLAFIHGFMGDPSDWDLVRREFSEYSIVTPLIRPAMDWASGVEQLGKDIPSGSVLIGYSMGARLSLALALSAPGRYSGLVFCSGNPGIHDAQRAARYAHDCKIADRIDHEDRQSFLQYWYGQSTVFESLTPSVRADEIERKAARGGDDWAAIIRAYSVAKQPNFWPRLTDLIMPSLAIAGLLDRKYARMVASMRLQGNIEPRIVAACGHIVHREQPHVFVKLLRDFTDRHFE